MTIKIVTDSTADLPVALVENYAITRIPIYINIDGQSYLDGEDISRQEFYEGLPTYKNIPTTSVPGPGIFCQAYERLAQEGATEILSIHISPKLSGTLNVAQLAAQETRAVPVTVFDSQQLSFGVGLLVRAAAQAVEQGNNMDAILMMLNELTTRTYVFAVLDTLEFLRRSGRMNFALAGLGSLLKIKPILKMNRGNPTSEKVRTQKRALARLMDLVRDLMPLEALALVHTYAPDKAEALRQQTQPLFPVGKTPLSVSVTPVIGTHIGPGAVGFACIAAAK